MYIEGTTVHNASVGIKLEHELRIRQISQTVRAVSPDAEINLKLLKCEKMHEVLLWGSVNNLPLGIYSRGFSLSQALDTAAKRVATYCAKARALRLTRKPHSVHARGEESSQMAMAS